MVEFILFVAVMFALALVAGVIGSLIAAVVGVLMIPFGLIALVIRGLGVLLALPFLLVFALIGLVVFGAGIVALLIPALPLIGLVWLAFWLLRRPAERHRTV